MVTICYGHIDLQPNPKTWICPYSVSSPAAGNESPRISYFWNNFKWFFFKKKSKVEQMCILKHAFYKSVYMHPYTRGHSLSFNSASADFLQCKFWTLRWASCRPPRRDQNLPPHMAFPRFRMPPEQFDNNFQYYRKLPENSMGALLSLGEVVEGGCNTRSSPQILQGPFWALELPCMVALAYLRLRTAPDTTGAWLQLHSKHR